MAAIYEYGVCIVLKADESAICLFQFSRKQKPEKLF